MFWLVFSGCRQNIIKLPCVVCSVHSTYWALEGERVHTQCTERGEIEGSVGAQSSFLAQGGLLG